MNKSERNTGARLERYSILRKVRAMKLTFGNLVSLNTLEAWLLSRDERTAKRKGGLGRGK